MSGLNPRPRYIGDDWVFPLTYSTPSGPVNLAGWVPEAVLHTSTGAFPLTLANGGAKLLDAVNGRFGYRVDRSITEGLKPDKIGGPARLQVTLTDPAGTRETLFVIQFSVLL